MTFFNLRSVNTARPQLKSHAQVIVVEGIHKGERGVVLRASNEPDPRLLVKLTSTGTSAWKLVRELALIRLAQHQATAMVTDPPQQVQRAAVDDEDYSPGASDGENDLAELDLSSRRRKVRTKPSFLDRRVLITRGKHEGHAGKVSRGGNGYFCVVLDGTAEEVMKRSSELELIGTADLNDNVAQDPPRKRAKSEPDPAAALVGSRVVVLSGKHVGCPCRVVAVMESTLALRCEKDNVTLYRELNQVEHCHNSNNSSPTQLQPQKRIDDKIEDLQDAAMLLLSLSTDQDGLGSTNLKPLRIPAFRPPKSPSPSLRMLRSFHSPPSSPPTSPLTPLTPSTASNSPQFYRFNRSSLHSVIQSPIQSPLQLSSPASAQVSLFPLQL